MASFWGLISRAAAPLAVYAATVSVASAQGSAPEITGNGWIAIAVIVGLVAFVVILISGALNVSRRKAVFIMMGESELLIGLPATP